MDLRDKKILVVGLGYRTGLQSANFLVRGGALVTANDIKPLADLSGVADKLSPAVRVIAGHQETGILDSGFDLIVLSPGVPARIPLIAEAIKNNIPVISEVELAFRFIKGRVIAITGTDGKSTTTAMTGHILKSLGYKCFVGGNIGIPLVSFASDTSEDSYTVAELSSFQLETIEEFRPDAAAFLNIAPDHMDRYDSMDDYISAKFRIAMNQTAEDFFIYNADDEEIKARLGRVISDKKSFSLKNPNADIYHKNSSVFVRIGNKTMKVFSGDDMTIMGLHNIQNAMASILLVSSVLEKNGIIPDCRETAKAACGFSGLPHRLEMVGEYMGRSFVNDSKATTVAAVKTAVASLKAPGVLIVGGRTKGDDYSKLADICRGKIRAVVCMGESKKLFADVFEDFTHAEADDMDDAVANAFGLSSDGDVVLLSPACASFDMFDNYEHRGSAFRESFKKIAGK